MLFAGVSSLIAGSMRLPAQDQHDFPSGYDVVEAAPQSHKVLFENRFVRVLEVTSCSGSEGTDASSPLAEHLPQLGCGWPH